MVIGFNFNSQLLDDINLDEPDVNEPNIANCCYCIIACWLLVTLDHNQIMSLMTVNVQLLCHANDSLNIQPVGFMINYTNTKLDKYNI